MTTRDRSLRPVVSLIRQAHVVARVFDYAARVYSRVVHHWWNGSWGRMNRRDVYVRTDGHDFELELCLGGSEGRRWRRIYPTVQEATDEAGQHMSPDQRWVDISRAHRPRAPQQGVE